MPGNPLTDPNWAPDLADQITTLIGKVRDRTTNNAIRAVRAIVFGLLGTVLGVVTLIVGLIFLTRLVQVLLDFRVAWDKAVYLSYFGLGGILTLTGAILMSKRSPR